VTLEPTLLDERLEARDQCVDGDVELPREVGCVHDGFGGGTDRLDDTVVVDRVGPDASVPVRRWRHRDRTASTEFNLGPARSGGGFFYADGVERGMLRVLLLAFAAVEIVAPERLVAWGERRAFENPEVGRLRPTTLHLARLEGVAALWLVRNRETAWPGVKPLFAVLGLPALLLPQPFLRAALAAAYENPDEIEPKPWVVPFTRVLGACYVLVALWPAQSSSVDRTDRS
jgi:hypothetical protein